MAIGGTQVARIALQADVGGFVRNFAAADSVAGKFGATLEGAVHVAGAVGSAIDAAAQKAIQGAKHVALFGAGALTTFAGMGVAAASFETRLKNVQSLLGEEGPAQFQRNFAAVLEITREFPLSANDAAEGLYNITSSGKSGADALEILHQSSMAAAAGLTTVENASTAIMAVMNAYGLEAKDARDISDTLFQTVNLGVLRFEDLTGIIGDSVGTAAAAGVSYDQLGAAVATMTLSGISAEESGTSLNRLIQSMIDPSEELASAFKALGYENGSTALHTDGLRVVMEKLQKASQGNITTLLQWFPEIRAARGALALMSAEGQNYARVSDEIENKQNRAGATQRAFAAQSEATSKSFQAFINALHAAAIEIGQYFLPPARIVLNVLTSVTNAFGDLPGPIKAAIGYVGALSGVFLALGGAFLAFRLRTAVTNTALQLFGVGLQRVGARAGESGASIAAMGTRVASIQGPFGISRALFGGLTAVVTRFGSGMASAGERVTTTAANMSRGGTIVGFFGNQMQRASQAGSFLTSNLGKLSGSLRTMAAAIPAVIGLTIALYSAWTQGKQAAQDFVDNANKGLDPQSPGSLSSHLGKLRSEMDKVQEKFNQSRGTVGGFLDQVGKNATDLVTNIVGIDVVKDSTWDNMLKSDALSKAEKKIVRTARNLQENVTAIFNELHPNEKQKLLSLDSKEMQDYALIAKRAGIDLTDSFSKSGPARIKAAQEVLSLTMFLQGMGIEAKDVTEGMIAQFQKMSEAEKKAGEGAAKSFQSSFDLLKTVDITKTFPDSDVLIPIGLQIEAFYTDAYNKATAFYGGIEDLQRRGADPRVIQKFLQAGPEAAGAVVQAAVEDGTNGLIQVLNRGEQMLNQFQQRAVEMARLTQRALSDPTDAMSRALPQAQQIANEIFSQGKLASVDSVAAALSMDPNSVRQITGKFGITLGESVNFNDIFKGGGSFSTLNTLRSSLDDIYNSIINFTKGTPQQAAKIVKDLSEALSMPARNADEQAARLQALREVNREISKMDGLTQGDRTFVMKLAGDEEVRSKIANFFQDPNIAAVGFTGQGPEADQRVMEFLLSVVGQEDAVQKVNDFATYLNLVPEQWMTMLELLGTPEAVAKALEVRNAIAYLQDKNIEITAENVDAVIKSGEVQRWLASLHDKNVNITASDNASGIVQSVIDRVNGLRDKTITVTTVQDQVLLGGGNPRAAYGYSGMMFNPNGVKSYAGGGMAPQYASGRWPARIWAEPASGGESYIPWAKRWRGRALSIMGDTASAFGYDLVPAGAKVSAGSGGSTLQLNTTLALNGPFYGDQHLLETIKDTLKKHERKQEIDLRRDRSG